MLKNSGFTIVFLLWMGFVTVMSLISLSGVSAPTLRIPHMDKIVHFTFYFVATILGCFFARERTDGKLKLQKATMIFSLVTIIYGIIIEVLQHKLTVTRDGNIFDALANITGTFVGALIIIVVFSSNGRLKWRP
ncbi:VanZ family protein [Aggregatimonas sangjinii]|uniref:VanZ family protein n=1 Tax=Aggregatimonas sangjinii TaxID=2583587 RepID=A0A5B7SWA5_9FLAO|nr:VanZ family protein [Aggregatimonas sangjinii]QCX01201.1 VanZ family protein [Aggregatimonas sangjinii]